MEGSEEQQLDGVLGLDFLAWSHNAFLMLLKTTTMTYLSKPLVIYFHRFARLSNPIASRGKFWRQCLR